MAIRSHENLIGAWAFFIGVIIAIVLGLFQVQIGTHKEWVYVVLALIGFGIGLLNVGDKDVDKFLLASAALVIVSYMGQEVMKGSFPSKIGLSIGIILTALLIMFVPATVVVALKSVFSISKT